MRATFDYRSGLVLDLPEGTNAAELLLEFIADEKQRVEIKVSRIHSGKISVRTDRGRTWFEDAVGYINANLPDGTADNNSPLTEEMPAWYRDQMKVIRDVCTAQTQTLSQEQTEQHKPHTRRH